MGFISIKASSSSSAGYICTFVHSMVQNIFISVRGRNFTGTGLGKNNHLAFGIQAQLKCNIRYIHTLGWILK